LFKQGDWRGQQIWPGFPRKGLGEEETVVWSAGEGEEGEIEAKPSKKKPRAFRNLVGENQGWKRRGGINAASYWKSGRAGGGAK